MNLEQPRSDLVWTGSLQRRSTTAGRIVQYAFRALSLLLVLWLLAAAVPSWLQTRNGWLAQQFAGHGFNLVTWEVDAVTSKLASALDPPAAGLDAAAGAGQVTAYLDRAQEIGALEKTLNRLYSEGDGQTATSATEVQAEIDRLRAQQADSRAQVEQIIEWQVRDELARAGLALGGRVFPPVQFTFTEPPKKLIVSPRDRIAQTYYRMLTADIGLETIETAEARIYDEANLSSYVTRIGGLGAYPAMVVDRASLSWVLSTVAHEWVHNCLTLAPLGIRYSVSQELTTMNETVAEIVGDEVGERVLRRHYPELVPTAETTGGERVRTDESMLNAAAREFDFRTEMRATRLEVDRLLAEGKVEEAEAYMEQRRQEFVENGYPLRVLNQAYFAFHGAYGTSPASTDPIGPKLFQLREFTTDIAAFLQLVRTFTSVADLEAALAQWSEQ
jgi:hypothetical protein